MRLSWALSLGLALGAAPASAQDGAVPAPPIVTLDQERLFLGTDPALALSAEYQRMAEELAAENRRLEAELTAEELDLTERRPSLLPEEFRKLADAFDEKVQRVRTEQDAKERALSQQQDEDRQAFLRRITPILADIARERGALVVMDRRAVLLSADSLDITEEAINRINAELAAPPPGDAPLPEPDPMPAPESPAPDAPAEDP